MLGIENFITFIVTALLFIMTPGIDTVFVLNKSIGQGRKSGIVSAMGINTGILTHTFLSAIGLTVLIAKSAIAFMVIKYIGAAYLVYIGVKKYTDSSVLFTENTISEVKNSSKNDFWSGFFTNSLNPKVALFFLAFFPQFITPSKLEDPIPFVLLGVTFAIIGVIWYVILTLFASTFSTKIKGNPNSGIWLNKISGFVFVLMGLQIAFG
ncbi:threonine/homoserine/homoserine lactone efflux protein [Lacinutrix venerupis]|uniref:LysE family translocator n=1 Tax=Lacinutrix venerupis TaxID=1486034 RepID=UPI000EAD289B|nr:LysE family translocator [Lacinutrix venerupis]RLJ68700.1 threonine/homoserine/homoserine lactone efflux protein [Lacinutrix venerupis]